MKLAHSKLKLYLDTTIPSYVFALDVPERMEITRRFALDKRLYDDFERGDNDTYSVPIDDAVADGLTTGNIRFLQIEKSRDGLGGGWYLQSFEVRLNGRTVASKPVNKWLENNHRSATASMRVAPAR